MVEMIAGHPGWEELQAYGLGQMSPGAALALEEHLARCARCCELLDQAPGDSFVSRLRDAAPAGPPGRGSSTDAGGGTLAEPAPAPPELVDHPRYRVLGLVGQGGMGAVYLAEHLRMGRQVALKVISPDLVRHPGAVQRFQQEVRAAARLHHPNIVHAYDADQAGGLHFLVMEYVEGTSLAELVHARGPLPPAEACEYARQAALGLQHAHEQGMVHRDIKPHNLMLEGEAGAGGRIKILDFGLARLPHAVDGPPPGSAPAAPLTGAGSVMGTADYIAPEQAADPRAADIRADIYALGCTLFHLLTGRPPFPDGTVAEKLARHAGTPLPSLAELRPEAPPGLAAVLARMTARDPADRFATPAEVAGALAPFCPQAGSRPRPGGTGRLLAALALLAAGGLAAGVLLSLGAGHGEPEVPAGREPAPTVREKVPPSPEEAEVPLSPEEAADRVARAIRKLGGRVTRNEGLPGRPVVVLDLAGSRTGDADLHAVAACKQLTSLDLSRTRVTDGGLKQLTGLGQLKILVLSGTRVTDAGLEHLAGLKQLSALTLESTAVGDAGLKHLAGLPRLHLLVLSGTRVSDAGMADIGRLNLLTLGLRETPITDAGLKALGSSSPEGGGATSAPEARPRRLQTLDLSETGVTDRGLEELARFEHLNALKLGGVKVTDAGLRSLRGLSSLALLDLAGAEITHEGLRELARHRRLQHVNLLRVRGVTDAGLEDLAGLPELRSLVLGETAVTDAGLRELARFRHLTVLSLTGADQVTEAGVAELRSARPGLQIQR